MKLGWRSEILRRGRGELERQSEETKLFAMCPDQKWLLALAPEMLEAGLQNSLGIHCLQQLHESHVSG